MKYCILIDNEKTQETSWISNDLKLPYPRAMNQPMALQTKQANPTTNCSPKAVTISISHGAPNEIEINSNEMLKPHPLPELPCFFNKEADWICFVNQPKPAVSIAFSVVAGV